MLAHGCMEKIQIYINNKIDQFQPQSLHYRPTPNLYRNIIIDEK